MTKKQKKMLRRILVSAALMVALLFVPVQGWLRFALWLVPYLIIGWDILCAMTLGIGNLWLRPYKQAAIAAFYREISGTEQYAYACNTDI